MVSPDFLDKYSRLDSPIHRLPAGLKLSAAIALLLAIVIPARIHHIHAGAAALLLIILLLSRVPPWFVLKRVLLLEPFVLGVAVLALFQADGRALFAALVLKGTLCLLAMVLLSNTTPFAAILRVLRAIRVPALLITTLALMYRYLFVLLDESQRMRRARRSRSFSAGRSRTWRSMSTVIGQLFIRASGRAERIYAAMTARGWQ
jgi:cobalt/nickel transport system permease protein